MEAIRDRAYNLMYLAEQKFGHSSAAHSVAWTVFVDVGCIQRGESAPLSFPTEAEMAAALDLVEKSVAARGRARAALYELSQRPHIMRFPVADS
jgi:hypothetical protein